MTAALAKRAYGPPLEFTAATAELAAAAGRLMAYVDDLAGPAKSDSRRWYLPVVMQGILIEATPGRVNLLASNFEVTAAVDVPAEVAGGGYALPFAKQICPMLRNMPGEQTRVSANGATLTLESGKCRYSTLLLPVDDYPAPDELRDPVEPPAEQARRTGWENELAARARKCGPVKPWKAANVKKLFASVPYGVGDWVVMPDGDGTRIGQVWQAPAAGRAGWVAVPEGDGNALWELRIGYKGAVENADGKRVPRYEPGSEA